MVKGIRCFVCNCDVYNGIKIWRERKWGLLKPLIPEDRLWAGISINFIMGLSPFKNNKIINIIMIIYWLLKNIIFKLLKDLEMEKMI